MKKGLMQLPTYDPNNLIDALIDRMGVKNDAGLARVLTVAPPVISKIRHFRLPVGASMLIRMHEESGITIRALRTLMGDRRKFFGIERPGNAERPHKTLTEYVRKGA